jgi:transaldolase
MKATQKLHDLGQSLWLDNITRDLLNNGTLKRYIDELSVTGLTSNPTIFDHAIKNSATYDDPIRQKVKAGRTGEDLFFDIALEDLTRATELFKPIFDRTNGVDGWVSLEVSPLLAHDTASTLAAAKALHQRAGRPNLFIKIPGTPEGLPAIGGDLRRRSVNVTLLFCASNIVAAQLRERSPAASSAHRRGLDPRSDRSPRSSSAAGTSPSQRKCRKPVNKLGVAIGQRTYKAYHVSLGSDRQLRAANAGARAQRSALGQHCNQGSQGLGHSHVKRRWPRPSP